MRRGETMEQYDIGIRLMQIGILITAIGWVITEVTA